MLSLNMSEPIRLRCSSTIDYCYSLHLANLFHEFESVELSIEQALLRCKGNGLYRCDLIINPKQGSPVRTSVEWEDCIIAIDRCFAKAKRYWLRRKKGMYIDDFSDNA